ncbi:transposase [Spirosoma fluviale]|uniref:REP element-mobilizing transposase RayT n=1 Tax=Spirosoma fluviale TaxID=1597977 RepID=A0A286GMJ2_9BACT|nr:transposase [Spirosoma fluviale]SOD96712.1 REP element-mobilizing transposase RayT [Spirosoma fluviale]
MKIEYARNLPHLQYVGATFFITFCLKGSLPAAVVQELIAERDRAIKLLKEKNAEGFSEEVYKEHKRYFARIERTLDACQYGPDWLKQPSVAELVARRIREANGAGYELLAYCIMSNHVHLVVNTANQLDTLQPDEEVTSANYRQVYQTLKVIKGGSAFEANRLLDRKGAFWQSESYDHYVRDSGELKRILNYTVQNPVKAGLVMDWQDWPFTYLSERV